jgi:type I restriction enzyme S subunit
MGDNVKGWTETTVGDFAPFLYGKGLPERQRNQAGTVPVFGSNGVVGMHNEALVNNAGIIIGRKGTVGAVHFCKTPFWPIDTTFYVENKPNQEIRYIYYLLRSLGLEHMNADSAVPGLNRNAAHARKILLPPIPEQKAIASILGALDDKIELNRKMNDTIEAMARAIFKSWFVDFDPIPGYSPNKEWQDSPLGKIPKRWRVGSISNIAEVSSGERPEFRQNLATADCSIPLYGGGGQMGFVPAPLYKEPILLTGRVGTLGQIHRIVYASWPSDNTLVFRPYNKNMFEYLYFNLKNIDFDALNRGSTQPLVTQSDLKKQSILIPLDDVLQYYHNIAYPLFLHTDANNEIQSRTLAAIRDALLPKLLLGEMRIKSAERFVEGTI